MLVTESRPRNLRWVHAGPLLYGDWGTSRLYVLGLAFLFTAHASVIYLAAIGVLMLAVSWAYTIVCRCFPDGGGVYTAARQINPTASVVGATLLLSGYIMTAAISVIEAFHYFGVPDATILPLSILSIIVIGGVNWLGAKSAGRLALFIAFAALGVSGVMAVLCVPFFIEGVRTISFDYFRQTPVGETWVNFTKICLALAGVEAVANMTGLMKHPVEKEAKRTIWPVSLEVVGLNMVFGLALAGLGFVVAGTAMSEMDTPDTVRLEESRAAFVETLPPEYAERLGTTPHPRLTEDDRLALPAESVHAYDQLLEHEEQVEQYTNASMKIIATEAGTRVFGERGGFVFGKIAGITFGLLLLSATNTATMAMVSVLFAMGQDRELPKGLTKLNYSGVPWVGLVVAVVVPIAVISVEQNIAVLAQLYVLGVCGAITVTVGSCVLNRELDITKAQRLGMSVLAVFLLAITLTIGLTQWVSTAFSGGLVLAVLGSRYLLAQQRKVKAEPVPEPTHGWLAELRAEGGPTIDPSKPKIMLAARGRFQAEFAVDLADRRGATLFSVFVRQIRVIDMRPGYAPRIEDDAEALESLGATALFAHEKNVPFVPIYITTASDIADEILDHTATYGCDTLIMGKSRRPVFARKIEGDVVSTVAQHLPDSVALITRSANIPHKAKTQITAD